MDIDEHTVLKDHKFILLAKFNETLISDEILPQMEKDIYRIKKGILNDKELLEFTQTVSTFNKVRDTNHSIYFYNLYAYEDIPIGKEYDVIGVMDSSFNIREKTLISCKSKIIGSLYAKSKHFPMDVVPNGHSTICLINFPDGIPGIINTLYDVNSKKPIHYDDVVFLCTYKTLEANNIKIIN